MTTINLINSLKSKVPGQQSQVSGQTAAEITIGDAAPVRFVSTFAKKAWCY
ncbi:MAG: hypothetical protein H7Z37_10670 [Pyrinomonadaceae bacterium]|nr:hypothetical protein [Pyrinomonadaceae bacterium]